MRKKWISLAVGISFTPTVQAYETNDNMAGSWQCDSRYASIMDPGQSFTINEIITKKSDGSYQNITRLHWYDHHELSFVYLVRFRGQWQLHKNLLQTQYAYEDIDVWVYDQQTKGESYEAMRENVKRLVWQSYKRTAHIPQVLNWYSADRFALVEHEDLKNYYANNPPPNKKIGDTMCQRIKPQAAIS